ncbi:MAG TPA: glycolate oxidase subunit GlcF [Burkholderiaceae bacterium]|nr:glycolate oxidase subunit GlcF [Burkholderiaceae bacterium]
MQTELADFIRGTPEGDEAEEVLRRCVHCGFCTATCPTYQVLGDELDGPRGRIYLMKQALEGKEVTASTRMHLDRCLTCRNCESTCPSGVEYGRLVDVGRKVVEERAPRPWTERVMRGLLKEGLTSPIFGPAMKLGQRLRPLLPAVLRNKVPERRATKAWPTATHARKVIVLEGCVQPAMQPNIGIATARVLDAVGVQAVRAEGAGCCGAIRYHLSDHDGGLADMKRNIDAWWPRVEAGAEAIVIDASGCGAMVKEYGRKLRLDAAYAEKAKRISELTLDLAEYLPRFGSALADKLGTLPFSKLVFHPPCTLQHGQQVRGAVEGLLTALGAEVRLPPNSHLCCGSAGTYSVLHPQIAYRLRDDKLRAIQTVEPQAIVSANIGCIVHLQSGTTTPVRHWIEIVEEALASRT